MASKNILDSPVWNKWTKDEETLCLYLFNLWNGIYYWHIIWRKQNLEITNENLFFDPLILSLIMAPNPPAETP